MINLVNVSEIRVSLEALAHKLENTDSQASLRLRNLVAAVADGQNVESWSASDIYKIIDPDEITERYKSQARTSNLYVLMRIIRIILLFVLIIITCFGISQAIMSYKSMMVLHPNQVAIPFLYLWQQGFSGLLPAYLTPSGLILIDIILLLVILGFTLLSMIMMRSSEREATNLHANLVHTLAGAALFLQKNQTSNTLISPGGNLDKVTSRIEQMTVYFSDAVQTLNKLTAIFDALTRRIDQFTAQILQSTSSSDHQQQEVIRSLYQFTNNLEHITQVQQEYSTAQVGRDDLLLNALVLLEQAAKTVVDASGNFRNLPNIQATQQELTAQMLMFVRQFGDSLYSMRDLLMMMKQLTDNMNLLPKTLETGVQSSLQAFETLPDTMKEAIESYADTASSIARVSKSLDRSAISIYKASEQILKAILKPGTNPETFAEETAEM